MTQLMKISSLISKLCQLIGGLSLVIMVLTTMTDVVARYLFKLSGAAHIHVSVMGPSISTRLITQMYFEGDPLIPLCPIVDVLKDPDAVETMIGRLDMSMSKPLDCLAYRFDIVVRGALQTYFEE